MSTTLSDLSPFNVRDFGATGDGVTMETAALQQAIDQCHEAGGGQVLVPAGRYLTAPLRLRSHVELHLARGATLLGSTNPDDYPELEAEAGFRQQRAAYNARYLLLAFRAENVAITGEGSIDGQGFSHYDTTQKEAVFWPILNKKTRPGRMIWFLFCRNVRVENASFVGSPAWTFWFSACEEVKIHGITIKADLQAINTDGIDIDSCRNVVISHCDIHTGDDCIVLRAIDAFLEETRPCEQVLVENCTLRSHCNAIRFSYLYDGVIRNATFRNITILESYRGVICQIPAPEETPEGNTGRAKPENLVVENITFENLEVEAVIPLWFYLSDNWVARSIGQISFTNVTLRGTGPSVFKGNAGRALHNISLHNVAFHLGAPGAPAKRWRAKAEIALALEAEHLENFSLTNVTVDGEAKGELPLLAFHEVANLHLTPLLNRTPHPQGL